MGLRARRASLAERGHGLLPGAKSLPEHRPQVPSSLLTLQCTGSSAREDEPGGPAVPSHAPSDRGSLGHHGSCSACMFSPNLFTSVHRVPRSARALGGAQTDTVCKSTGFCLRHMGGCGFGGIPGPGSRPWRLCDLGDMLSHSFLQHFHFQQFLALALPRRVLGAAPRGGPRKTGVGGGGLPLSVKAELVTSGTQTSSGLEHGLCLSRDRLQDRKEPAQGVVTARERWRPSCTGREYPRGAESAFPELTQGPTLTRFQESATRGRSRELLSLLAALTF